MAEKFDEFMQEVENDIRNEKYINLWNRYGKFIISLTTVGLVCLVGYNLWSNYEVYQRTKASDVFIGAQDFAAQNRQTEALSAFQSLRGAISPYEILARFNEAGILSVGDPSQQQQAIKIYQEIINTKNIEKSWHHLATYQKVSLQSEQRDAPIETLLGELETIDEENSPVGALALELKGVFLLQKGDKTQGGNIFVKLAQSKTAPEGVVMRSQLMTQIISAS
jgi:hypothetical protein